MQMIGFLSMVFFGMTIVNRVMEGQFITASDMEVVNQLTIFRPLEIFGLFSVPVPNLSYFTVGIPRLVMWDYSFFGGNAQVIQFALYSATAAISFLLFTIVIGLLYQFYSRIRG